MMMNAPPPGPGHSRQHQFREFDDRTDIERVHLIQLEKPIIAERNAIDSPGRRPRELDSAGSMCANSPSCGGVLAFDTMPIAGPWSCSRKFRGRHPVADGVDDLADAFEADAHFITGFERGDLAAHSPQFAEAAAVAERPGAEHVAGDDPGVPGRVGDE